MYAKPYSPAAVATLSIASALLSATTAIAQMPTPVRTESVTSERVQEHRRTTRRSCAPIRLGRDQSQIADARCSS